MSRLERLRVSARCVMASIGVLAAIPTLAVAATTPPALNTVYNFGAADYPDIGNFELSPLLQASDGNLYGVSAYGGVNNIGYVYKVSPATGRITHLHDFGYSDGAIPRGALIQGSDGALYGTTESGGANQSDYCVAGKMYNESGCGTLFRITTSGAFTKLHDFYTAADGYQASPGSGVVQGSDGNFYGMAVRAFPISTNALFKMTPDGSVAVEHLFATDESEGYLSYAGLLKASDGSFYGTTAGAGAVGGNPTGGCGTVFKAGIDGSFQTLHVFTGSGSGVGDGCVPWATLMEARDGNFYGTTSAGGYQKNNCIVSGCGIVFRITSSGTETVLHRFTGTAADGEYPQGDGLVQTADGSLYGATGGNPYGDPYVPACYLETGSTFSCGTVFKLDSTGRFTQIAIFGNSDGAYGLFPHASPILASDGNLYGTTISGGGEGEGTVYRLLLNASTPVVAINGFTPAGGPPGTSVTVNGTGFSGATQLTFGGGATPLPTSFNVVSDSEITTQVPVSAQSAAIGVTAPRGTTYSPVAFYLQPRIDSMTPSTGRPNSGVTLNGAHFDDLTSIVFGGGVPATRYSYVTDGDTSINVTVPALAKSGPIIVTNPGGSAQSPTFVVKRGAAAEEVGMPTVDDAPALGARPMQCARFAGERGRESCRVPARARTTDVP